MKLGRYQSCKTVAFFQLGFCSNCSSLPVPNSSGSTYCSLGGLHIQLHLGAIQPRNTLWPTLLATKYRGYRHMQLAKYLDNQCPVDL